jgi:maleylacetoacetate isomerase
VKDGGEQHQSQELARNPLAQVPTLELENGTILTQSLAIIDYLEQLKPQPTLYPQGHLARAQSLQLAEMVNSGIQPLQNLSLLLSLSEFGVDKVSWAQKQIEKGLLALEKVACQVAQTSPGLYLVGESPSVADLCLIPQLYNARRFKVDLQLFPRLCEVEANCQRLEAFQRALPEVQADAQ